MSTNHRDTPEEGEISSPQNKTSGTLGATMGTKKNIYNLFGNLSNMADHKFLSGGKSSRDPSPRPKTKSSSERDRDPTQENWNKDQEKAQHKDVDTFPLKKGGKEQKVEGGKSRNGRLVSNIERGDDHREKEIFLERGTFPRMSKNSFDPRLRMTSSSEMQEKRERRPNDYPKREEIEDNRDKRNHETGPRSREVGKNMERWSLEDERLYQREKYRSSGGDLDRAGDAGDFREIREKDAPRKREKARSDMDRMDPRMYNTDRVYERDSHSDRREKPQRREETKDSRGDRNIDERQPRHERYREDGDGQRYRNKDTGKEEDRTKKSRAHKNRKMERSADKVEERYRETDRGLRDEMRNDDRHREERRTRERKNGQEGMPGKRSECHSPGGGRDKRRDTEEERMHKRRGDSDEERKTSRHRTGEQERGEDKCRDPDRTERSQRSQNRTDRDDGRGTRGNALELGRMWLDPQRGKNSKESRDRERRTRQKEEWSEEETLQAVKGRDERRDSGEPDERYSKTLAGRNEFNRGEPEGACVDRDEESKGMRGQRRGREDSWQKNGQTEYTAVNSEESDREEGGKRDYSPHSRNKEGNEVRWKEERDRISSAEDGFMTLSSSGDEIEKEFRGCGDAHKEPTSYDSMEFESHEEREEDEETFEQTRRFLDQINIEAMSEEQVEAIRVRMSGAWSTDDPKRYSHPPHLKWATSVVREILGTSEENAMEEPTSETQKDQSVTTELQDEAPERATEVPAFKIWTSTQCSDAEGEDYSPPEDFGGMGQMHMLSDQLTAGPVATPTSIHADTLINTGGGDDHLPDTTSELCGQTHLERKRLKKVGRENEMDMYLDESYMLYKPYSCPSLNYSSDFDLLISTSREYEGSEDDLGQEKGFVVESDEIKVDIEQEEVSSENEGTCGSQSLGFKADFRRRGIRVTTERRSGTLLQMEGVAGDHRTKVFSPKDDADVASRSMGDMELRANLHPYPRKKRNSKYFKAAQLYQQYSEAAQNIEILRQGSADALSGCEGPPSSPVPSPPPSRRPLPSLPPVLHPHSLSHQSHLSHSFNSFNSLPLPESHSNKRRPSSPRLSISQPGTLWRDLPGVRNSYELEELTENQWRLQEVRFEVVTSEASYCRSLDIVAEHFVKCKPLQDLLGNQDRNWLFSRLLEVRAISHRFLEKLEERVDSDIMHFTVCDIIAHHCKRFRSVYVPYLTNQSYQDSTYQRLMTENPTFKQLVESIEKNSVCQRLPLRSFLVLPFQRITRIKLLVQNIVKRTTPGTAEAKTAIRAMKLLETIIQQSNDSISQMKSIESLVSLNAKVDFDCKTLPLISQSRRWVREGPVIELIDLACKDPERNLYLHLFNDYLLLSLQKEGGRFTVINHAPVNEVQVENCRIKLHSLQKNLFRLQMSTKFYLLKTDTQSDKLRWISALSRPHPQLDFSAAQDCDQMLCVKAYMAQQPDELSLEKAEVILVHQDSSENWVEGTRLSDFQRGWVLKSHLETINNLRVKERNLSDAFKLTTATAATVVD
ncbi:hypothetical protein OJAV_G00160980 [Oryzias javanicus]|uniref:DH domain-containing protein n=1 Tax=Oryzias javanicus TaxID=123683 RepID=A0A3S2PBZ2_ORYJA|nr:hypothetical protein OJAV_G00160980 [Oryzias javanicus]